MLDCLARLVNKKSRLERMKYFILSSAKQKQPAGCGQYIFN